MSDCCRHRSNAIQIFFSDVVAAAVVNVNVAVAWAKVLKVTVISSS